MKKSFLMRLEEAILETPIGREPKGSANPAKGERVLGPASDYQKRAWTMYKVLTLLIRVYVKYAKKIRHDPNVDLRDAATALGLLAQRCDEFVPAQKALGLVLLQSVDEEMRLAHDESVVMGRGWQLIAVKRPCVLCGKSHSTDANACSALTFPGSDCDDADSESGAAPAGATASEPAKENVPSPAPNEPRAPFEETGP